MFGNLADGRETEGGGARDTPNFVIVFQDSFLKTVDEYDFTFQSGVRLSLLGSALSADLAACGSPSGLPMLRAFEETFNDRWRSA